MQIVEYKIENKTLTVGFKKDNFVVFSVVPYLENKSKNELLQEAYQKIKSTIDYEKTLDTHSITTNMEGEEFIPEALKPIKLEIDFNKLEGNVLDQYGDIYSTDIQFTIEGTDKVKIENKSIIEKEVTEVTEDIEYYIIASYKDLIKKQKRILYAKKDPEIVNDQIDDDKIALAEAIIDLNTRVQKLEGGN